MAETEYSYWMIWVETFEGNRRWYMGRFLAETEAEQACDIVRSTLRGGVGDDTAEVIEAEEGYDNELWEDYSEYQSQ